MYAYLWSLSNYRVTELISSHQIFSMEETGDNTWGHLASTSHFGSPAMMGDHIEILKEDIRSEKYKAHKHASHCLIYAKNDNKAFGIYKYRATILMHLRFDGLIGFPGGLVDEGEDFVDAVNRELREEIHLDTSKYPIQEDHHIISHVEPNTQLCLHFFAREIELEDLNTIEKNCLNANDFGEEVMGTFRVPLYTMGDGIRGFPAFLSNSFIGNAREQLLHSLKKLQLMVEDEIDKAVSASEELIAKRNAK